MAFGSCEHHPITPHSRRIPRLTGRLRVALLAVSVMTAGVIPCPANPDLSPDSAASTEHSFLEHARATFNSAHARHLADPSSPESAWQLAKAGFELADLVQSNKERARVAEFGIRACRAFIDGETSPPVGIPYYLALNLGQLARTKTLGALKLVREMEDHFLVAIEKNEAFAHAGPHRCLGLLYRDAPGWPASVGDSDKARTHLNRALELQPTFPDNRLCMIESALEWKDIELLERHIKLYTALLPHARSEFTGQQWTESWHSWNRRWTVIQAKAAPLIQRAR